jgi:hypothetical protein
MEKVMFGKLQRYELNAKIKNKMYRKAVMEIYQSYYKKDPNKFFEQMQGVIRVAIADNAISNKSFNGLLNIRSRAFYKASGKFNV